MEFFKNQRKTLAGLFVAVGMLASASAFAASQCSDNACSTYTSKGTCTAAAVTNTTDGACSGGNASQTCVNSCY